MAGPMHSGNARIGANLSRKKIAIVVAEWNEEITEALYAGAFETLIKYGIKKSNIERVSVPGSFELPLAAKKMALRKDIAAVIGIGCVIQGETPHFDYICQAVAHGIMSVSLDSLKPVSFGVLTTLDKKQAMERAGGTYGNKGEEAALTALRMLAI